jgi:hypothetical protein
MAAQAVARLITPKLPRALPARTRKLVEDAIERHQNATTALIAFLDAADGDADFEPSLGSSNPSFATAGCFASKEPRLDQTFWAQGGSLDEREFADDCEEGSDEDMGREL